MMYLNGMNNLQPLFANQAPQQAVGSFVIPKNRNILIQSP